MILDLWHKLTNLKDFEAGNMWQLILRLVNGRFNMRYMQPVDSKFPNLSGMFVQLF